VEQSETVALVPWDPNKYVAQVEPAAARLSRGFLRCRPEKWFPGFGASWLPLAHSLGIEIKMIEVKPVMAAPRGLESGFAASVDDEPVSLYIDGESSRVLTEMVCPGAVENAKRVIEEYFARRLLTTLEMSWSGPESSVVRFNTEINPDELRQLGAVKLTVSLNGANCVIWILLGKLLVERLDGLWRRQVQASARQDGEGVELHLEIAQLAVPPSMLSDYVKSGTVIDLEVMMSDAITLSSHGKAWLPARLCNIGSQLGFEVRPGPVAPATLPDGTTRLSIEFGRIGLNAAQLSEVAQVGAVWETGLPLGEQVQIVINGEVVGSATLCTYEGRFAISVA